MPSGSILSTGLVAVALTFLFTLLLYQRWISNSLTHFPPGPPKIPIFGNLFQVSPLRPHPKFHQWAQDYGPIFHLRIGPQNVIVLNTSEAANDLFVNRSRTFSSRAPPHVAHDIMSAGQRMVFMPYGKEWKTVRRTIHSAIGPGPSKQLRPVQELESRVLIYDLMNHGDKSLDQFEEPLDDVPEGHWFCLVRRYPTSVVMTVAYGKRIHKMIDNPHLHKIYHLVKNFTRISQPGNYLADAFPILRKLPDFLAPWRVEGRRMHAREMDLFGGLLDDVKQDIKNGITHKCYVGSCLKQRSESGYEDVPGCGLTDDGWLKDTLLAYSAATILQAGSDTVASTMHSFILFMLSNPDVLQKARKEVDRAVGSDRMPGFEDEPNMPYVVACIKETLRRRPPLVMGIPHSVDRDEFYKGYLIPKGSTVIGNTWTIHMDPVKFPNPAAFMPERFLVKNEPMRWGNRSDQDRDHYAFGWGRRFCPGSDVAEASLFISLSRLIWGIDFQAPTDPKTGMTILPDVKDEIGTFTDGFLSSPRTFKVSFKPRSEKHAAVIRQEFKDAQAEWQCLGLAADER